MPTTAEHIAKKMLNNIGERINKERSSNETIKYTSLNPLSMRSSGGV